MSGSSLVPIIVPIAATLALAAWLFMIYYADSHPYWAGQRTAHEQPGTSAAGRQNVPEQEAGRAGPADGSTAERPRPAGEPEVPHAA